MLRIHIFFRERNDLPTTHASYYCKRIATENFKNLIFLKGRFIHHSQVHVKNVFEMCFRIIPSLYNI